MDTITPKGLPEWIQINSIEASKHNKGTAYLAATTYKNGDFAPYLYKTTNYGNTWTKIINGISVEHFTRVIREDANDPNFLYTGTETGLYYSKDAGRSWNTFEFNLPIVPITDLAVKDNDLIVATQGRGLWIYDHLDLLRSVATNSNKGTEFYDISDAYRYKGFQVKDPRGAGTNKASGMEMFYHLESWDKKKDSLSISIINPNNDTVTYSTYSEEKKFKLKPEEGSNRFNWNLAYPGARNFDGMVLWWGNLGGPKSVPGVHQVVVNHNGKVTNKEFNLMMSPISEGSKEDILSQYEFVQSINKKVDEAHKTIIDIRSTRKRINNLLSKVEDEELQKLISEIDSISGEVEKNLYQTKNRSRQDPLNFPIKLTNKLGHLNSLTQMGGDDFPPTRQAIAVRDELVELIDKELAKYKKVEEELLPRLNKLIIQKEIHLIK
jgi:uncharacterized protein Yka (UPF0111/DUF47 family)